MQHCSEVPGRLKSASIEPNMHFGGWRELPICPFPDARVYADAMHSPRIYNLNICYYYRYQGIPDDVSFAVCALSMIFFPIKINMALSLPDMGFCFERYELIRCSAIFKLGGGGGGRGRQDGEAYHQRGYSVEASQGA